MKKKEKGLYDILDWFEENNSEHIKLFWKCAFKETVLSHNPKLQMLRKSLMDGKIFLFHDALNDFIINMFGSLTS